MTEDPKLDGPQMPEPLVFVNASNLASSRRRNERGGTGDQHTWSETATLYHNTAAMSVASAQAYAEALAAHRVALAVAAKQAESAALKREAHTWSKAAETYAKPRAPLTRQQIDDVMTQHYPLSSLLREEVDAFEACVRDIERLHGIGA
ncbi:MAG: hypothetical protein LW854_14965 [Rubrivivax sp.]|jgi:hypothetical protein|nr:hypothetical protein [Rubrivivax sp.]